MKPPAPTPPAQWDPWTTFAVPKEKLQEALKRKELHEQRKLEFQKMMIDPKIHTGKGGHVFDPAVQRFYSARSTAMRSYLHGRNSPGAFITCYLIPVLLLAAGCHVIRKKQNEPLARGEVKTRDKEFKIHSF